MELAQYAPYTIQRIYQLPVGIVIKFIELPGNFDSLIRCKYIAPSDGGWFVIKQPLSLKIGTTLYFAEQYPFLTGYWFRRCDGVKQGCETVKTSLQDAESDSIIDYSLQDVDSDVIADYRPSSWRYYWQM